MSEEVVADTPGTVVPPETDLPTIAIPTSSRVRARFARFGGRTAANPVLEPLLRSVRTTHPKADLSIIERAYAVAEQAHEGQMRKSGDPYITHPLAVATILAELGMTPDTLAAALLHDTVEDTAYSLEAVTADFGRRSRRSGPPGCMPCPPPCRAAGLRPTCQGSSRARPGSWLQPADG